MQWLPREEITLLLATLVAHGLLVLGTLELIWPTRPRRPRAARNGTPRAGSPPARGRPPAAPRPPEPPPVEDRAALAFRIGRALLERALRDPDPASDPRVRMLCRAIACLERGLEAAPGDPRLREVLAAAREALAKSDQRVAFRWLSAVLPLRPAVLVQPALESRWAGLTSRAGV
ncbi:MAG TPA: hypothetical protein VKG64_14210 [Methylomirabilota bacterium]|nr:hypothetical protein [Methylomirabilota bacterium]